ncbi:NAD(P)H-binding protein [Paenibacillus sp. TRM 82003]|nr:NAD(P)H-binding protein [Paenibacillus sp. TRM 82003]
MKIFVTGGTGYVGTAILSQLAERGFEAVCLVRPGSRLSGAAAASSRIRTVEGDLLNASSYRDALAGCDAAIHLVGIIREAPAKGVTFERLHVDGTRALVDACVAAGYARDGKRLVHMSALGARPGATTGYFRTKWTAEELVRASGLPHVIFRPSVIFGPEDEFVNMLADLVRLPLTPVIGSGRYRMQPVSLRTISDVFVKALTYDPVNVAYDVGGPDQIAYNDMLREIGAALGRRRVRLVHAPLAIMRPVVRLMERFPFFPITTTQLTMLLEENICRDGVPFYEDYKTAPLPFAAGIREYLRP